VFRIQTYCLNMDKLAGKYEHKFSSQVFRLQLYYLNMDKLAGKYKVDNFPLTCSLYSFIASMWKSSLENINIKLIISLSRVPYTVLLPECTNI